MEAMVYVALARRAAGVLIARGAAGVLVHAAGRMHRVILPVPISAGDDEVVGDVLLHPGAKLIALVLKGLVGVIVGLVGAVGTDDGRWADKHPPVGVALEQSALEPFLLLSQLLLYCLVFEPQDLL